MPTSASALAAAADSSHARERGRLVERGARTEHGHRAGDGERLGRQPPQPPPHRAADALGPEVRAPGRVLRGTADVAGGQLVDQLAEQERVASGRAVTGRAEAAPPPRGGGPHDRRRPPPPRAARAAARAPSAPSSARRGAPGRPRARPAGSPRRAARGRPRGVRRGTRASEATPRPPSAGRRPREQRLLRRQVGDQPVQALQRA